jgi:hypothetical protein
MPNLKRLRKLAKHIVSPKRGHAEFDFARFNNMPHACGTAGCAIGELPVLWPGTFAFTGTCITRKGWGMPPHGTPPGTPPGPPHGTPHVAEINPLVGDWFDIPELDVLRLFHPGYIRHWMPGSEPLGPDATAEQVSESILAYCAWCEKNETPTV